MTSNDTFGIRFTRSWVAFYTRSLDEPVGERRRVEMASDLWEQLNDASSGRASAQVLDRCLRGIPADVWWRYRTLLEQRGVRQRSQNMMRNILTNWWVVFTAILGAGALTSGVAGLIFGGGGLAVVGSVGEMVSGSLILGGLAVRHRRSVAGSWMIAAGAAMAVVGVFTLPAVVLVVIGGLWTGHLQLSDTVDQPNLQPVRPQPADITTRWYLMLLAALILFAIGFGALMVMGDTQTYTGEEDISLIGGLAWFAWILSWLGAVISAGVGIVFGAMRLVVRHRTRPA